MPVKTNIAYCSGMYFITFTCINWLSLFEISNGYNMVYKWFNVLKQKGHYIVGYVIMPNHVHCIIAFNNTQQSINTIVGNGKRVMAYEMVLKLQELREEALLLQLQNARSNREIRENKLHKVFETSFDWKVCNSNFFMEQRKCEKQKRETLNTMYNCFNKRG